MSHWTDLPFDAWADTAGTLHLWTQIVGKIRMESSAWQNHAWHVTLYVTPRGLTTGTMSHETTDFSLDFDFFNHQLVLETSEGVRDSVPLRPQSTASFYQRVMNMLEDAACPVSINTMPNEIADAIPFDVDDTHDSYDPDAVHRWWQVLSSTDRIFREFRAGFWGKASPSHFFWGSFDLAVTRFSGRRAPDHPGGLPNMPLWVAQEAYSHEVSSAGFWPGGPDFPEAIFYSYAYPTPDGMAQAVVEPDAAFWSKELSEFVLPLKALTASDDPDATLQRFLQTTFDAAATIAQWDLETQSRRHFPDS